MKIIIHRGIDQIGGCITEIASYGGTKILIDLGHNLPDGDKSSIDSLESHGSLDDLLSGVSHIFYSHYHNDHLGFEAKVSTKTIQHIGALSLSMVRNLRSHMTKAKDLCKEAQASLAALNRFQAYISYKRVQYGDIFVTPLPVSHSAIDAHMFLIECDGKIVLHTGDFRDHGYRGEELLQRINDLLKLRVDVLIIEGTMLARADKRMINEVELQDQAIDLLNRSKYVFVLCSSMDADRLTSFSMAAQRQNKKRRIIADRYQVQQIIAIKKASSKPYNGIFAYNYYNETRIELDRMKRYGFMMFVRNSKTFEKNIDDILTEAAINPHDVLFIYSQFMGYLLKGHKAFKIDLYNFVHRHEWNIVHLHTSGHASKEAIKTLCELANPTTAIIPIHKEGRGSLQTLNLNVDCPIIEYSTVVNDIEIIIK